MEIYQKKNKRNSLIILIVSLCFISGVSAQSFWFGPYGGPTIATQTWNNYDRGAALLFHAGFFIETYDESEEGLGTLYASLGYHQRGGSARTRRLINGSNLVTTNDKFIFNNVSLEFGAKGKLKDDRAKNFYYGFGLRGEYNINTNLDDYQETQNFYYPVDVYVRKFTAGASVIGGYNLVFGELYGGYIQFAVQPDFFNQYFSPIIPDVRNPYNSSNSITLQAQAIKNISFEVTFGIRFLRKVEYY